MLRVLLYAFYLLSAAQLIAGAKKCDDAVSVFSQCVVSCSCSETVLQSVKSSCTALPEMYTAYTEYCTSNAPTTCDPMVDIFLNGYRSLTASTGSTIQVTLFAKAQNKVKSLWFWGAETPDASLNKAFLKAYRYSEARNTSAYQFSIKLSKAGSYTFGSNARDILYPKAGQVHQASEGCGSRTASVKVTGAATDQVCNPATDPCCVLGSQSSCAAAYNCAWRQICYSSASSNSSVSQCRDLDAATCGQTPGCTLSEAMCSTALPDTCPASCSSCQDLVTAFSGVAASTPAIFPLADVFYKFCVGREGMTEATCADMRDSIRTNALLASRPRELCMQVSVCTSGCFGSSCLPEDYQTLQRAQTGLAACLISTNAKQNTSGFCQCQRAFLASIPVCDGLAKLRTDVELNLNVACASCSSTLNSTVVLPGQTGSDGRRYCVLDSHCASGSICLPSGASASAVCNPVCSCTALGSVDCISGACLGVCSSPCDAFVDNGCSADVDCASGTSDCPEGASCYCDMSLPRKGCSCSPDTGVQCQGPLKGVCAVSRENPHVVSASLASATTVRVVLSAPTFAVAPTCANVFPPAVVKMLGSMPSCFLDTLTLTAITVRLGPGASIVPGTVMSMSNSLRVAGVPGATFAGEVSVGVASGMSTDPVAQLSAPPAVAQGCDASYSAASGASSVVTFDAAESMDPLGKPLTFQWSVDVPSPLPAGALAPNQTQLENVRAYVSEMCSSGVCRTVSVPVSMLPSGPTAVRVTVSVTSSLGASANTSRVVVVQASGAPAVQILGPQIQSFMKSQGKVLQATVSGCIPSGGVQYRWSFAPTSPSFFLPPSSTLTSQLVIPPQAPGLQPGTTYNLQVSVTAGKANATVLSTALVSVTATAAPVSVVLAPVPQYVYSDQDVTISAAKSFDPDTPAADQALSFTWTCVRAAGGMCFENMTAPSSFESTYTVPAFSLESGEYTVSVTVSVRCGVSVTGTKCDSKAVTRSVPLSVLDPVDAIHRLPTVTLSRVCISACTPSVAPAQPVRLVAQSSVASKFVWVYDSDVTGATTVDAGSVSYLVLPPGALTPGRPYTFRVNATDVSRDVTGHATLVLDVVDVPTPVSTTPLKVSPSGGVAQLTQFEMSAVDWSVSSASSVSYEFGYYQAQTGRKVAVRTGSVQSWMAMSLPAGDPQMQHTLVVYVCASTSAGAQGCANASVTVTPPADQNKPDIIAAMSDVSALMDSALIIGDDNGVVSSVLTLSEMLPYSETASGDRANLASALLEVTAGRVGSLDPTLNYRGISSALEAITAGTDTLLPETYSDSLSTAALLASYFSSMAQSGDVYVESSDVSSVLSSVANVLGGVASGSVTPSSASSDVSSVRDTLHNLRASVAATAVPNEPAHVSQSASGQLALTSARITPADSLSFSFPGRENVQVSAESGLSGLWSGLESTCASGTAVDVSMYIMHPSLITLLQKSGAESADTVTGAGEEAASATALSPLLDVTLFDQCGSAIAVDNHSFVITIPAEVAVGLEDAVAKYVDASDRTSTDGVELIEATENAYVLRVSHFTEFLVEASATGAPDESPSASNSESDAQTGDEDAEDEGTDFFSTTNQLIVGACVGVAVVALVGVAWHRHRKSKTERLLKHQGPAGGELFI
eukprot:TRINITY_DN2668_c0_g1::TRINITY_DN2668_c0_g1_i1::g.25895::m.25895 TRINITY_DN2668_c0_g1::TRINITY_DN2668_c0_g1_i1::g.25895  ORF type:complete len:1640 (+),score=507.40,REJ/PF02010.10/5.2e-07,REJ/PF02010.10/2.4e-34,fn3/PF00041.16/10,fn3/PF00041.16/17,SCHIP-1/PF10148.4/2e+03,SCHIP-1/PF10148.4/2.8 TRINITY_DN2668_c0_g1_i1:70-4989(+)